MTEKQNSLSETSMIDPNVTPMLFRDLRVHWVQSDLTLGQVWDVDLLKNETVIRDVLSVAQGENALEEFLKQVSSHLSVAVTFHGDLSVVTFVW